MTLTEIAIKRPTLVVVLFTFLGLLGMFSYSKLKYELLPDMSIPIVTIRTIYPGASPAEVETSISKPIEDAVSGLDKVARVLSKSREGLSLITVEFDQSANMNLSSQDAERKINEILPTFPATAKKPVVSKLAFNELPVLRLGAVSNMPATEYYQFLLDNIKPRLSKVKGVGQVYLIGGDQREIKINLNMELLNANNLSISQVTNTIKASNLDFPTGNIKDVDNQFTVRLAGKFTTLEDIKNLVVATNAKGGEVRIRDIAEVEDGIREYSNITRLNGATSVGIQVVKQSDANAVDVSKLVREELKQIEKEYKAKGVKFIISQDSSTFTIEAANAVQKDLMIAIILVALVMLLFLHSIRNSFIVMIAIPASLISTFAMMYLFGFTLNLMTLLAMSLVIGILVDDSIVVLENIYRYLEMGKDRREAALTGRNEIGFAALSITLVDVVVFVPLALVTGIVGNILREFSLVMVTSTLLSLLVSFTITPALASRLGKVEHINRRNPFGWIAFHFERFQDWLTVQYKGILRWSLSHKLIVFISTFVLLFSSFTLVGAGFIGFEFITQSDRGEFGVSMELRPGATLEETNQVTMEAERRISSIPEVQKMFTDVGASNDGVIGISSNNTSEIVVQLIKQAERKRTTNDIIVEIKDKLSDLPGVNIRVSPIGIFGTSDQAPIQILATGTDDKKVFRSGEIVKELAQQVPGATDVKLSSSEGKPETRVEIDREKLAAFGLNIADVGNALRVAFTGDDDTKFKQGNTEYSMRIQLDQYDRSNTEALKNISFVNMKGQKVLLQQFASLQPAVGPSVLERDNRNRSVMVQANVIGRPSGDVTADIRKKLDKANFPEGVEISYLGQEKNMQESGASLGMAIVAGILLVYLIMVALYNSFMYPFVVLFSIPMAVIGAFLALAISMSSLSIFTAIGLIMLIGLVAKNAILLVDRANQVRRDHGLSAFDALLEAAETRLRPILMTTIAMVIGMMPIAFASGAGAEWKKGLAWALIGGLTSSMFLSLVLVPAVYLTMTNIKDWITRKAGRKSDKTTAVVETI